MEKRVCFDMEQFGCTHTKKYQRGCVSGIFLSQLDVCEMRQRSINISNNSVVLIHLPPFRGDIQNITYYSINYNIKLYIFGIYLTRLSICSKISLLDFFLNVEEESRITFFIQREGTLAESTFIKKFFEDHLGVWAFTALR